MKCSQCGFEDRSYGELFQFSEYIRNSSSGRSSGPCYCNACYAMGDRLSPVELMLKREAEERRAMLPLKIIACIVFWPIGVTWLIIRIVSYIRRKY